MINLLQFNQPDGVEHYERYARESAASPGASRRDCDLRRLAPGEAGPPRA